MKILITGAKGQLGNELQKQLREEKSEIGAIPTEYNNAEVTAIDIDILDLSDRAAVFALIEKGGFDLIINCAAYTNVEGCESDFETAYAANALAPSYLASACKQFGGKLVHVSTDYVFPGDGDVPRREYDLVAPTSVYGKTKLMGEQLVRENCGRYFIVRTAWLYGYIGKNFVKTMINRGRSTGALKVVNDQYGNPTSAADLAHHILKLGVTEYYGLYHCTNNGVCSWYDFACEIIRLKGVDATVSPCATGEFPTVVKRPAFSALDNMVLRLTVGDEMRDWRVALKTYVENLSEENL